MRVLERKRSSTQDIGNIITISPFTKLERSDIYHNKGVRNLIKKPGIFSYLHLID